MFDAELGVGHFAVGRRPVAVADHAVAPRQQNGGDRGAAGLGRARCDDAGARVDGAEPRAVVTGCAGGHRLKEHEPGQDLGVLLRHGRRDGRRRGGRGRRRRQDLADEAAVGGGRDQRVGHVAAEHQRADRGKGQVERIAAIVSRGTGQDHRHLFEVAGLEGERDAGAAHVLVGLEGDHQERVQRLEGAGDIVGLHDRADRVQVGQVMHDARQVALIGHRRTTADAGARVGDVASSAHVVHVGLRRIGVQLERTTVAAGHQSVAATGGRDGLLDHLTREHQSVLVTDRAAGTLENGAGPGRLDPHAGALEQRQRGRMDRFDGLGRPEIADDVVHGRLPHRSREAFGPRGDGRAAALLYR